MNCCTSPYGEDAYGRQFGNVQPGPADYQLDRRLSLSRGAASEEIQCRAAEMEKQMVGKGWEGGLALQARGWSHL